MRAIGPSLPRPRSLIPCLYNGPTGPNSSSVSYCTRIYRELEETAVLENITCCATHGLLPLISTDEARRAQVVAAVRRFNALADEISQGSIDIGNLAETEGRDNLFHELDFRIYCSR